EQDRDLLALGVVLDGLVHVVTRLRFPPLRSHAASGSCPSGLGSKSDALPKHRHRLRELCADASGFVADLVMREAQRRHPRHHVRPVSAGVPKLRGWAAVVAEAVRLNDVPELRPEVADLESEY